jgi:hypothetical protein
MRTADPTKIVHEIAESTDNDEQLVSQMYADAVQEFRRDAHIMDYAALFAAKRVRERLKARVAG